MHGRTFAWPVRGATTYISFATGFAHAVHTPLIEKRILVFVALRRSSRGEQA